MFRALITVLLSTLFFASCTNSVRGDIRARTIVVADDGGGIVQDYDQRFTNYRQNGTFVVIKGLCASACARYMLLPNVCAAKGAEFAFHSIWGRDEADIMPEEARADSARTDNAVAFALESRYDAFHMGVSYTRPYMVRTVEPGVRIRYDAVSFHGRLAYEEMLFVDADRLIPACKR